MQAKVEGNDVVRPAGLDLPETKKQPADLTEILRASVAALKSGRGKADGQDTVKANADKEDKPAKTRTRRKAGLWPGRRSRSAISRSTCAGAGYGPAKASAVLAQAGIPDMRRNGGRGEQQRRKLTEGARRLTARQASATPCTGVPHHRSAPGSDAS